MTHNTRITVTLAQMPIALGDPEANIARARALVVEAARRGSDVLLLPELWHTGYALEQAADLASPLKEGIFATMCQWAQEHALWIAGSALERREEGFANTAILASPTGELVGVYRKVHLFGLMEEDRYLRAGEAAPVWEWPWGRVALAICYDLRFPELFRHYALQGATLVLLPAEWPCARARHWRVLVQARAIENQYFIVACNRVGTSKGETFCGHSMVVSPWGDIIVEAGEQEILLTVTVDLNDTTTARNRIPILRDRRPEVYTALLPSPAGTW